MTSQARRGHSAWFGAMQTDGAALVLRARCNNHSLLGHLLHPADVQYTWEAGSSRTRWRRVSVPSTLLVTHDLVPVAIELGYRWATPIAHDSCSWMSWPPYSRWDRAPFQRLSIYIQKFNGIAFTGTSNNPLRQGVHPPKAIMHFPLLSDFPLFQNIFQSL